MSDHPNLAAALVAALADLTMIEKGRTAKVDMTKGGSYTYDYADLGDIVKVTRPALAAHGLVALTPVHDHGNGLACTVILLHTSGEKLALGPFPFPHGRDAQATGSMVTYHRRYALLAALGMATGEDDDGASAVARAEPQPRAASQPRVKQSTGDTSALVAAAKTGPDKNRALRAAREAAGAFGLELPSSFEEIVDDRLVKAALDALTPAEVSA